VGTGTGGGVGGGGVGGVVGGGVGGDVGGVGGGVGSGVGATLHVSRQSAAVIVPKSWALWHVPVLESQENTGQHGHKLELPQHSWFPHTQPDRKGPLHANCGGQPFGGGPALAHGTTGAAHVRATVHNKKHPARFIIVFLVRN